MGFPNTAYQPGQAVWYINQYDEPQQSEVEEVVRVLEYYHGKKV